MLIVIFGLWYNRKYGNLKHPYVYNYDTDLSDKILIDINLILNYLCYLMLGLFTFGLIYPIYRHENLDYHYVASRVFGDKQTKNNIAKFYNQSY